MDRSLQTYAKILAMLIAPLTLLVENIEHINVISYGILLINFITVWLVRKNIALLIPLAFVSYSNYSILAANHLFKMDNFFTQWSEQEVGLTGVKILLIFSLILLMALPKKIQKVSNLDFRREKQFSSLFVLGLVTLLVLVYFFAYQRPTVDGARGNVSPLFEYSIILFLLVYQYSGKQKIINLVISMVLISFCITELRYGGRVTALQLIIIYAAMFIIGKWPKYILLLGSVFGLLVLTGIGAQRANFSLDFGTLGHALQSQLGTGFVLDTAYAAYYCSLTFIECLDIFSLSERIFLFSRWFLSIFLGSSSVSDSVLPYVTSEYFLHYSGGIYPFYVAFYTGVLGFIPVYFQFRFLLDKLNTFSENSTYFKCVAVYVVCTVPRWYLYSPSSLFRGIMILSILHWLLSICTKSYKMKRLYRAGQ